MNTRNIYASGSIYQQITRMPLILTIIVAGVRGRLRASRGQWLIFRVALSAYPHLVTSNKSRKGRVLVLFEPLRHVIEQRLQLRTDEQPLVFHTKGRGITDWRKAWGRATREAGCPGVLFHDIRRTVVRNLVRAGVPERMAMTVTGHKTQEVFDRYGIVTERDVALATARLAAYVTDTDKIRTGDQTPGDSNFLQLNGRGVAQPGSAPALGAGGRRFKSSRPDHAMHKRP